MKGINGRKRLGIRDLLCPKLYQKLEADWPYTPPPGLSFESLLNKLLEAPPISTLRVNTLRCTDSSSALAEAVSLLGLEAHIHPNFPDILVFPRKKILGVHTDNDDKNNQGKQSDLGCIDSGLEQPPVGIGRPHMVVVGAACGQALLKGSHVFAPGVLAAESGITEGSLVRVWALPRPFRCTTDTSDANNNNCMRSVSFLRGAYLTAENKKSVEQWGIYCGEGKVVQPLKSVFLSGKGLAIQMQGACDLSDLPPSLVPQQFPSAIVGYVLNPQPNERVLDMCAAPGHKTSHLAALMCNKGVLVAIDRSKKKVEKMRAFLARLGASMVECVHGDSAKHKWQCSLGGAFDLKGSFDKVLADVTCTGLGLRPRIVYDDVDIHSVTEAARYQREFISKGCELLRPRGVLVYSTCSISPEENERNVQWALANLPLELEAAEPFHKGRPMPRDCSVHTPQDACKLQRFCPSGETTGFFIAKLRKKQEPSRGGGP